MSPREMAESVFGDIDPRFVEMAYRAIRICLIDQEQYMLLTAKEEFDRLFAITQDSDKTDGEKLIAALELRAVRRLSEALFHNLPKVA